MSIIVYWMEPSGSNHRAFDMTEMSEAITFMNGQRSVGCRHVSMSVENPDMVGKVGVDAVEDGKTPDGQAYTWMKRRSS